MVNVGIKNPVFSQFNTNSRASFNNAPLNIQQQEQTTTKETSLKKDNKDIKRAIEGTMLLSPLGALHGFYKKHNIKISSSGGIDENIFENSNPDKSAVQVNLVPENSKQTKPGVKKIAAEKGEKGWEQVGFFDVVKGRKTKGSIAPSTWDDVNIMKIKGTRRFVRSSSFDMKPDREYAAFQKVLNPYDERLFNALRRIPVVNRVVDFTNRSNAPIKELNILNHKFYWNKTLALKGVAFAAWFGLLAASLCLGLKAVSEKMAGKQDKTENQTQKQA